MDPIYIPDQGNLYQFTVPNHPQPSLPWNMSVRPGLNYMNPWKPHYTFPAVRYRAPMFQSPNFYSDFNPYNAIDFTSTFLDPLVPGQLFTGLSAMPTMYNNIQIPAPAYSNFQPYSQNVAIAGQPYGAPLSRPVVFCPFLPSSSTANNETSSAVLTSSGSPQLVTSSQQQNRPPPPSPSEFPSKKLFTEQDYHTRAYQHQSSVPLVNLFENRPQISHSFNATSSAHPVQAERLNKPQINKRKLKTNTRTRTAKKQSGRVTKKSVIRAPKITKRQKVTEVKTTTESPIIIDLDSDEGQGQGQLELINEIDSSGKLEVGVSSTSDVMHVSEQTTREFVLSLSEVDSYTPDTWCDEPLDLAVRLTLPEVSTSFPPYDTTSPTVPVSGYTQPETEPITPPSSPNTPSEFSFFISTGDNIFDATDLNNNVTRSDKLAPISTFLRPISPGTERKHLLALDDFMQYLPLVPSSTTAPTMSLPAPYTLPEMSYIDDTQVSSTSGRTLRSNVTDNQYLVSV